MTINGARVAEAFFTNTGTLTITNGLTGGGGIFTNAAGGTINVTDDTGITFNSYFINQGTFSQTGGTGTDNFGGTGGEFEDLGGTINVDSGTFQVQGQDIFHTTQFNIATGAAFTINQGANSQAIDIAGNITGTGGGRINFDTGNFYAQDENGNATTATLDFPSGMANVNVASLGIGGATTINAGFLTFTGTTAQYQSLQTAEQMDNQGTVYVDTGTFPALGFLNDTTGVLDFQTNVTTTAASGNRINLTNKGTILQSGGTGTSIIQCAYLNDGGALDIQTGTLSFQVGSTGYIAGPITVAPGAVVNFDGRAGIYLQGTLSASGGGTVTLTNGWLDAGNGNFGEDGTTPAFLNFPANTFHASGGFLENNTSATLTNTGSVYFAASNEVANMINSGNLYFAAGSYSVEKGSEIDNLAGGVMTFNGVATLATDDINCRIHNMGTMIFDSGSGTTDLASQYPFNFSTSPGGPSLINTGTIEVKSGTLIYPSVSLVSPLDTTDTIMGGTYQVDAGASLTTETPVPITTNNGTIILGGLGANFPAISGLTSNTGTFAVDSGNTFSTTGNFTNSGTLSIGGKFTVNGNFAQSSSGSVLDFPIAAAAGTNLAPDFTVTGSTTLAGALTAEFADGFASGGGTPYTVAHFASPANGSFASTSGTGPAFTPTVNPTSIVLNSTVVAASDLQFVSVSAPPSFTPGQSGTITWQVTDATAAATGDWTDSVYLSADGTVNAGDLLLGRVTHTGGLTVGADYTGTLNATFPAAAGSFYVVVVVDSGEAVPDTNRANNSGASAAIVSSLPALTLGGSVTGTLSAGEDLIYTLNLTNSNDVRVNLSLASPLLTDLEISRGGVPSAGNAQFSAPLNPSSTTLGTTITQPTPGVYYILLQGQTEAGPSGQSFTLSATSATYGAFAVSPSTVGAGLVSLTVSGAGFTSASTAQLLGGGSNVVATATSATAQSENTLLANFDLTNVSPGAYSLKITTGNQSTTLANAVTVQAATASIQPVRFTISGPSLVRFGRPYDFYITYTNPNNVDVPAPIFQLSQPNAAFELVAGNADAKINPDTTFTNGGIELMAINQEGAAGVLPPGYTGVFDVKVNLTVDLQDSSIQFPLTVAKNATTYDLSSLVQPGPNGLSEVSAQILAAQINSESSLPTEPLVPSPPPPPPTQPPRLVANDDSSVFDVTPDLTVPLSALNQYLDTVATTLSSAGLYTPDFSALISAAASAADGFGAITQSQTAGPFGQGTPNPLQFQILNESTAGYVDVAMPSGTERYLENGTSFTAADPAQSGTLAYQSDGTLRLTELDGSFYQFNSSLNLAYFQTAGGLKTNFNYNSSGQVTSVVQAGGQTTSYTYTNGLVTSSTDPFGLTTTYGYSSGTPLLTTITTPAGTTTITYTATPTQQTQNGTEYWSSSPALAYHVASISLPDGSGQEFTYDGLGRLIKTTLLDGSDPVTISYDATGLVVTSTFADNSTNTDVFGPSGILLRSTDSTGNSTTFGYGPNLLLTSILAPGGSPGLLTYNGQNELASATSPTGATATLTYDTEGRIIGITDGNHNTVTQAYDSNSDVISQTFPDGTQNQYAYNSTGQLDQVTGRDGAVTNFTLNANGQPTQIAYSDGTSFSYTYDSHGDLVTSTDADGTTTYSYNAAQEVTSIAYPGGQSVSYQYDSNGRVTQESDQSGVLESYTYDSNARLSQVLDGSGNVLVSYTYDALGRVSMESFENGTKTVYSYNSDGDVASITNLAVGGTVSTSLAYTYDAKGNPLTVTDQSGNVTSYAYDQSGQLTKVTLPGGRMIQYNYDADGNRTSVVDSAGTESATYAVNNLDQYTTVGATTYTYDRDGNILTMTNGSGTTTYAYDPDGQLASSTGPAGSFTYSYSALGQLDSYTINGTRTNLLLDAAGNVIAAYDGSRNLIANYQYGLGLISQQAPTGSSSFYSFDAAGNTTAITNSVGAVVNSYSYLPFGEKLSSTGPAGNIFTFSGLAGGLDIGDGMYQTGARTYSPSIGRFIQPDPTGFFGGDINLYRYVNNRPLTEIDPSGLTAEDLAAFLQSLYNSRQAQLAAESAKVLADAAEDEVVSDVKDAAVGLVPGGQVLARVGFYGGLSVATRPPDCGQGSGTK